MARACFQDRNPNEVSQLVDTGYLKPYISSTFPLHDVQKAHALFEQGRTRGRIVLLVR